MSRSSKAPQPQTVTAASYRIGPPPPPDTMELPVDAISASTKRSRSHTNSVSATRTIYGKVQNLTGETVNIRELTLALRYNIERLAVTPDFNITRPFDLEPGEVSPMVRLYSARALRADRVESDYPISATLFDTRGRYSNTVTLRARVRPEKKHGSIFIWVPLLLVGSLLVLNRPRRRERERERERERQREAARSDPNDERTQP